MVLSCKLEGFTLLPYFGSVKSHYSIYILLNLYLLISVPTHTAWCSSKFFLKKLILICIGKHSCNFWILPWKHMTATQTPGGNLNWKNDGRRKVNKLSPSKFQNPNLNHPPSSCAYSFKRTQELQSCVSQFHFFGLQAYIQTSYELLVKFSIWNTKPSD